ncbi:zinc finger matrin-type protein 3-like [Galendromus occidentalis]|uniref:Zinc finger matrin-type protein 3-like n=1 Tax=Galendromus occidentalis TaxID=34638 RepID=A0AAJ7SHW4_9ACAR|nr:zinc finger matrin-type protein 3-like [Galendromus occidentalis]
MLLCKSPGLRAISERVEKAIVCFPSPASAAAMWRTPMATALPFGTFPPLLASPAPCAQLLAAQVAAAAAAAAPPVFRRNTLPNQAGNRFRAERWTPYSTSSPKSAKPATPSPASSATPPQELFEASVVDVEDLLADSATQLEPSKPPTPSDPQASNAGNDASLSPQSPSSEKAPPLAPSPSGGASSPLSEGQQTSGSISGTCGLTDPCARIPSLSDLMQPLYCKVCDAKLNGRLQASAHYDGKSHHRRLRQYLEKAGRATDLQKLKELHQQKKLEKKTSGSDKLEESFCKLCDVAFTSDVQAKQHYAGRNHQRRLRGEPPLPKGFYNPVTGKWQRQPPTGLPLKVATSSAGLSAGLGHVAASSALLGATAPLPAALFPPPLQFYCEACNIAVANQQQMTAHLSSPVHKARMNDAALLAPLLAAAAAACRPADGGIMLSLHPGGPHTPLMFNPLNPQYLHATMTAAAAPCGTLPEL